jgi:hypothetical protein
MQWTVLLCAALAWATPRSDDERSLLSEEMHALAVDGAWEQVDRVYDALDTLKAPLSFEDHVVGAKAAHALGSVNAHHVRLSRAAELNGTEPIFVQLAELEAYYGTVHLVALRDGVSLRITDSPGDPVQRHTIDLASGAVTRHGSYHGLLPLGRYSLGQRQFEVVGGPTVRVRSRR